MRCTASVASLRHSTRKPCGQPARYLLENGDPRCPRHRKGRGTRITAQDEANAAAKKAFDGAKGRGE